MTKFANHRFGYREYRDMVDFEVNMTPAECVIRAFGCVKAMADLTDIPEKTIYRWTWPRERGGSGGLIPANRQRLVLDAARKHGIALTPADILGVAA